MTSKLAQNKCENLSMSIITTYGKSTVFISQKSTTCNRSAVVMGDVF